MPTLIDSLAIEIGLDPAKLVKGFKQAADAAEKGKQGQVKAAKEIEAAHQKVADSADRVFRNLLKLYALFTAGREIKQFVSDLTSADSALGRLAKSIGQAPASISAVANAVERAGGSGSAAAASFQSFTDSISELRATGNTAILPFLYRLQAAGGRQINLNKSVSETFGDIADNLKAVADQQGVAQASWYGRQLGLDPGTIALLVKGRAAYNAELEKSRRLGIVDQKDADAAQNLVTSISSLKQASESLGRTILTNVSPFVVELLTQLQEWIEKNREWIATEIVAKIKEFGDWLRNIDWKSVGDGIKNFITGAGQAAQSVGGWLKVCEALFALWIGSKFLAVLANLGRLRLLLFGGSAAGGIAAALAAAGAAQVAGALEKGGLPAGVDPLTGQTSADLPGNGGAGVGGRGVLNDYRKPYLRRQWDRARQYLGGGRNRSLRKGDEAGIPADTNDGRKSRGATSAQGKENVASWMGFLMKPVSEGGLGMSKGKAQATVAMMQGESGGNLDPGAVGDSGHAHGTAQWSDQNGNPRFPLLKKFAASQGKDWRDRGVQQQYLRMEMLGLPGAISHRPAYDAMMAAPDDYSTLRQGINRYENPQKHDEAYAIRKPFLDRLKRSEAGTTTAAQKQSGLPGWWTGGGAAAASAASATRAMAANNNVDNSRHITSTTQMGDIHIQTAATDASGIARDMEAAIKGRSFATQANYGRA